MAQEAASRWSVQAGLRPPPPAADGLDRACHPAIVIFQSLGRIDRVVVCRPRPLQQALPTHGKIPHLATVVFEFLCEFQTLPRLLRICVLPLHGRPASKLIRYNFPRMSACRFVAHLGREVQLVTTPYFHAIHPDILVPDRMAKLGADNLVL
jgi:hypothetical protein